MLFLLLDRSLFQTLVRHFTGFIRDSNLFRPLGLLLRRISYVANRFQADGDRFVSATAIRRTCACNMIYIFFRKMDGNSCLVIV